MASDVKVEICDLETNEHHPVPEYVQIKEERYELVEEVEKESAKYFDFIEHQDEHSRLIYKEENPSSSYERLTKIEINSNERLKYPAALEHPPNDSNNKATKAFQCAFESCIKSFSQRCHLVVHMRIHTGEKPYVCIQENCGKSFKTSSDLRVHFKRHTGEKNYVCRDCGKAFTYNSSLNYHRKLHIDENLFACDFPGCDRSFKRQLNLNSHKKKVHIQGVYMCRFENCGKIYNRIGGLTFHMRTHSGDKRIQCEYEGCPKAFWYKHHYIEHQRVHSGEKPFCCDHPSCGKRYTSKRLLRYHQIEHENKVFVCTFSDANKTTESGGVCAKMFKSQKLLNDHMRRHTGGKQHKCEVAGCMKEFFKKQELIRHLRMHARIKP